MSLVAWYFNRKSKVNFTMERLDNLWPYFRVMVLLFNGKTLPKAFSHIFLSRPWISRHARFFNAIWLLICINSILPTGFRSTRKICKHTKDIVYDQKDFIQHTFLLQCSLRITLERYSQCLQRWSTNKTVALKTMVPKATPCKTPLAILYRAMHQCLQVSTVKFPPATKSTCNSTKLTKKRCLKEDVIISYSLCSPTHLCSSSKLPKPFFDRQHCVLQ